MTYRVRNIVIAVALALVAAMMTSFYVTNYQRNVEKDAKNVEVFVAKKRHPRRHDRRGPRPQGPAREVRDRPALRRPGRDLEPRPARGPRRRSARLRRRAGVHPTLRHARRAWDPGPADRARCGPFRFPATSTSCCRARSRPATTSTWSRRSRSTRTRTITTHADRPARHRGAEGAASGAGPTARSSPRRERRLSRDARRHRHAGAEALLRR